ncbi:MAG TPA: DUF554 family protein [Verrucomicrobiota bacterium]|nr:DUF554 family protein [Verrucomicrobiota bacterium]HNU51960.1 DUF554 family protein [Verrucomicrobiota bacterium]
MLGTIINAASVIAGSAAGLATRAQLAPARQQQLRILLGAFTVFIGLSITWSGLRGPLTTFAGRLLLLLTALILGRFVGHSLGLQRHLNRVGQFARQRLFRGDTASPSPSRGDAFVACSLLLCATPLALLGPLMEGLFGDWRVLALKSVMDGLAVWAFAREHRWPVAASAFPLFVWQGTLTLLARALLPPLESALVLPAISAAAGMLVFTVALVILEIKKVELANYLPSLIVAPLLAWAIQHF